MFAVYVLLLAFPMISAQAIKKGSCLSPYVQPYFSIHAFSGLWYEVARIPSPINTGICVTAEYHLGKGSYLTGHHTELVGNKFISKSVILRVRHPSEPAMLEISFSDDGPFLPYWVLYTDYYRYAVVYTCENHHGTHSHYVWVLGRVPHIDNFSFYLIKHALLTQGISGNKLEITDQSCYTKTYRK